MLFRIALAAVLVLAASVPATSAAQSLRGSSHSVHHAYGYAEDHDLHLYSSGRSVRQAVRRGKLVPLSKNAHYTLHRVSFPYVTVTTRTFITRLASQYYSACGEPLVITSAVRPTRRQPANSSPLSVHPAGIAVDLRHPTGGCLRWLRRTLLSLESEGVIDATEERHPAHFHVIVFGAPYRQYLASR